MTETQSCPLFKTKCGKESCAWYDKANDCCAIITIAMSSSIAATTAADNRTTNHL